MDEAFATWTVIEKTDDDDVDDNPKAYYFQQAQNELYAREAILCDVLGITLDEVKKSKGVIQ